MGKHIYTHIDVETVGGFKGRLVWDSTFIQTDASGNEVRRESVLIRESLPFLAADSFWSSRKNDLIVNELGSRRIVSGAEYFDSLQQAFDESYAFVAFNSAFEVSSWVQTARLLNLEPLRLPLEVDLALAAMDILNIGDYAKWAKKCGHFTSKGNISARCELILSWLGLTDSEHNHLSLGDTESQVALFKLLKSKKMRFPKFGKRIVYPSHPAWRKHLKLV